MRVRCPHRRQRETAVGKRLRNARAALAALERDADDQRAHRADARHVAANLDRARGGRGRAGVGSGVGRGLGVEWSGVGWVGWVERAICIHTQCTRMGTNANTQSYESQNMT